MKKIITSIVFLFSICFSHAQINDIGPKDNPFDNTLIKDETYTMKWFIVQDTLKHEVGEVTTEIQKKKSEIIMITKVNMPQATMPWVDSTIVKTRDFAPIYHSSYNQNRDMAMQFDESVTGYYLDKKTNEKLELDESVTASFFDSSSYPQLIRWLPLKEDYTESISIFDFNPNAHTGVLKATITNVSSATITFNGKDRQVWEVVVTDDISNNQVQNHYFIEKDSRVLLKHEIEMAGRKMVMERTDF